MRWLEKWYGRGAEHADVQVRKVRIIIIIIISFGQRKRRGKWARLVRVMVICAVRAMSPFLPNEQCVPRHQHSTGPVSMADQ